MQETESRRVGDFLDITQLKSRYCRCVDLKQWDALRMLFTADARVEGFAAAPNGADVDTFIEGVAKRLEGSVTVHHCHQPDVVFTGPETARGVWAMMDYNEWSHPIGMPGAPDAPGFNGYGFYEEEYRRVHREWRISFMRLTRLRVDPLKPRDSGEAVTRGTGSGWLRPSPGWLTGRA